MKDLDLTLLLPPIMLFVWGMVMIIIYIYLKERKDESIRTICRKPKHRQGV